MHYTGGVRVNRRVWEYFEVTSALFLGRISVRLITVGGIDGERRV